jgi:YidC/Oxa1 family membrane protein insertase
MALRWQQPADVPEQLRSTTRALSWLPFATVLFAAIVPLAATLYLAVSTTWTLVERTVLRRVLSRSG